MTDLQKPNNELKKQLASFIANSLLHSKELNYFKEIQGRNDPVSTEFAYIIYCLSPTQTLEEFTSSLVEANFTKAIEKLAAMALIKKAKEGLFADGSHRSIDQAKSDILKFYETSFLSSEESLLLVEMVDGLDARSNAKLAVIAAKIFDLTVEESLKTTISIEQYNRIATLAILFNLENKTLET